MDQLNLLLFLSFAMLIGSFLSGTIPMAFRLSDSKSRLLAVLGSGILVGTALAIIIPEGIDSLYSQTPIPSNSSITAEDRLEMLAVLSKAKTWIIGISLVAGFVLMLLIDQFSIYQGAHDNSMHSSRVLHSGNDYTLANQDDNDVVDEDRDDEIIAYDANQSETQPIRDTNSHRVIIRTMDNNSSSSNIQDQIHDHQGYKSRPNTLRTRPKGTKVTPTLGLVIHAAADGIALGAAATTSHREVEMIIFLAIMLHKGPAAFSLVVFLLHRGIKHSTIRKHLLAFSLSAPLAALVTFFGLSQSGKEALRQNNATGIAMLFSAGTFLYVATVHVLPELVHNKLLAPKELLFLIGGAFLPILLAQTV